MGYRLPERSSAFTMREGNPSGRPVLRYYAFLSDLEGIVANGLVPEGGMNAINKRDATGWLSFEKDPPGAWMVDHLGELKNRKEKVVALELDEVAIREEFEVCYDPRGPVGTSNIFQTLDEARRFVGVGVKVRAIIPPSYLTEESKGILREMGYSVD